MPQPTAQIWYRDIQTEAKLFHHSKWENFVSSNSNSKLTPSVVAEGLAVSDVGGAWSHSSPLLGKPDKGQPRLGQQSPRHGYWLAKCTKLDGSSGTMLCSYRTRRGIPWRSEVCRHCTQALAMVVVPNAPAVSFRSIHHNRVC